jgi:uncharacterized protein YaaN involved in tellurite resistance
MSYNNQIKIANEELDKMVMYPPSKPKPLFAPGTVSSTVSKPEKLPEILIEDDRPEFTGMGNQRYVQQSSGIQTLSGQSNQSTLKNTIKAQEIINQRGQTKHIDSAEFHVKPPVTTQPAFNPNAGKELAKYGTINPKTAQFLAVFDTPTGILQLGEAEMQEIARHSDAQLNDVKDVDISFVEHQLTQVITLAKSMKLDHKNSKGFSLHGLIDKVKSNFIDIKEQMTAEFTDVSQKMDAIIIQVDTSVIRVKQKLEGFQQTYQDNLSAYQQLTNVLNIAEEAYAIKTKELEEAKAVMTGADLLEAENINRMQSTLLRLDKKIVNLKKFQTMAIQTAPEITRQAEEAMVIIEKFADIKSMTIPLWKRKIRQYIDSVELRRAANLEMMINDANNAMLQQNSNQAKENAIAVATMNNRDSIDDETLEVINRNLIETIVEVNTINQNGAIARKQSVERMEEMKRLYGNIATGAISVEELRALPTIAQPKIQVSKGW